MERLRKYAEAMGAGNVNNAPVAEDDDEVPELVENFEEAANK